MNENTEATVEEISPAVSGEQVMQQTEAAAAQITEESRAQLMKQRESLMEVSEQAEGIVAQTLEKLEAELATAEDAVVATAIRRKIAELKQLAVQMSNLRQADAGMEFLLETQPSQEFMDESAKTMFLLRKVGSNMARSKMVFTDLKVFLGSLGLLVDEADAREMAIRFLYYVDRNKLEVCGIGVARVMARVATAGRLAAGLAAGKPLTESGQKFLESAKGSLLGFLAAARAQA